MLVAELILEQLERQGVERIYGVAGDAIFGLLDAMASRSKIRFISVRHESVAALMASAEAKLTGRLGVCAAQMGPGLVNLLNGLGDAYMDQAPVLAISGQAPLVKIGTAYKQLIDQQALVQAVSRFSQLVVHPDAAADSLKQAIHTALLHRTVAHLSIPEDLFRTATSKQPMNQLQISIPTPDAEACRPLVQIMRTAQKPMILAGDGARSAREAIRNLAKLWGSGIALSYGAAGVIPDAEPYLLGGLGEGGNPQLTALFQQADVVLTVDTSWWPAGQVPPAAQVLQLANRQANMGVGIPAAAGVMGEPALAIQHLIEALQSHSPNPAWLKQIQQTKLIWANQSGLERTPVDSPAAQLHPANVIRLLESHLDEHAVVTLDEGDSTLWFLRYFRAAQQRVLLSNQWRTMGFGLPAALAAKLNSPEKQVFCITGDGGLGMVLADLITAVRYGLPITVLVFHNGALQMERDKMLQMGLQPEGTELTNPHFARLAEACGWRAYRVQTAAQLDDALLQARSSPEPVLIEALAARIPYPEFSSQPYPAPS